MDNLGIANYAIPKLSRKIPHIPRIFYYEEELTSLLYKPTAERVDMEISSAIIPDIQLVQAAQNGDAGAFGELVRRYQGLVYGLAYNVIGNFADAQDIAQESFVKAFRNIDRLQHPERFAPWLKTITVNECKMALRANRRNLPLENAELSPSYASIAEQDWKRRERQAEVRQAVQSLPEKGRLIVTLHYLSGLSHCEIGEFLGLPANAVAQHLHRARRQLKQMLLAEIEEDCAMNRLPESFTQEVLAKISLYPMKPGYFATVDNKDGASGMIMAVGEGPDKAYITFWAKSEDIGEVLIGTLPARTSESPKGRALDSCLQVLNAFDIKLEQVVMRLVGDRKCRANAEFSQGDRLINLDMRPSDAMGLAVRASAAICAEDTIIQRGNVGEDDVNIPDEDMDRNAYNTEYERIRKCDVITDKAFEMMSLDDLVDTVRFHKDEANGILRVWPEACPEREVTFDLQEYGPGVDLIFDMAGRRGGSGKMKGDPAHGWTEVYKFMFSMLGDDARMRAIAEDTDSNDKKLDDEEDHK